MVWATAEDRVLHRFAVSKNGWVEGIEGAVEVKKFACPNALFRIQNPLRAQKIDRTKLVIFTKNAPRRARWRIGPYKQFGKTRYILASIHRPALFLL
jgi:hypothetical protein